MWDRYNGMDGILDTIVYQDIEGDKTALKRKINELKGANGILQLGEDFELEYMSDAEYDENGWKLEVAYCGEDEEDNEDDYDGKNYAIYSSFFTDKRIREIES